ncbi:hypothetical protein NA78x_003677 [Anatilimnocola sp. NA78]|uniref:hypothetical protein n=1 Tax=Anatilimnocola sp. NA78 TaxID=3415683 RepID=UPI003CE560AB
MSFIACSRRDRRRKESRVVLRAAEQLSSADDKPGHPAASEHFTPLITSFDNFLREKHRESNRRNLFSINHLRQNYPSNHPFTDNRLITPFAPVHFAG